MTDPIRPLAVFLTLMSLLVAGSCIVVDDESGAVFPCQEGEGQVETSKFELPAFTGIEVRSDVEVVLSQGPVQEVEARGHANVLEELVLEVDGQDLEVRTRQCVAFKDRPRLFITIPQLNRVVNSSAAEIFNENTFVAENPEITIIAFQPGE